MADQQGVGFPTRNFGGEGLHRIIRIEPVTRLGLTAGHQRLREERGGLLGPDLAAVQHLTDPDARSRQEAAETSHVLTPLLA